MLLSTLNWKRSWLLAPRRRAGRDAQKARAPRYKQREQPLTASRCGLADPDFAICADEMRFLPLPLAKSSPSKPLLWLGVPLASLVWLLYRPPLATASGSVVWLLLGAPIVEEVIFRLGLQQELLTRLRSAPTANVLTALAFAMAHGLSQGTWLSLLTVMPALAIGLIFQRSRRLTPCIALHALFNTVWLMFNHLGS
jgi:membrane protease YdiL (CAAX protease family)